MNILQYIPIIVSIRTNEYFSIYRS